MALIHLHGLVPAGTAVAGTDPPHEGLACGEILALVSAVPDVASFEALSPDALAEWALGHNNILMRYCAFGAVLPMRPGAIFSDPEALRREVLSQADHYLECLAALAELREYTVQLLVAAPDGVPDRAVRTGRAHLRARLAERQARDTLAADRARLSQDILHHINALSVQVEPAGAPKPGRLLDCVTLLPTRQIDAMRSFVKNTHDAATKLGLDLVVAGPWPAYSFDIAAHPGFGRTHVG